MATILELAAHAEVTSETVLRVLLREPTSEEARRRVAAAVEELGLPDYPRPDGHIEVLPANGELAALPEALPAVAPAHGADLALELRSLFRDVLDRLEHDRRERIDDLALTTDLVTEGWRTVDRRLGRLEKIVERLSRVEYFERGQGRQQAGAEIHRLDDARRNNG
jgi:hypothetical protein